jgi:anti-anti-sigma regulatory factor
MEGSACRLIVRGDLDRPAVRRLIAQVRYAERRGFRSLVVDLAECSFIDRVGVCVLLDAGRRARRDGRGFSVANPVPPVRALGFVASRYASR